MFITWCQVLKRAITWVHLLFKGIWCCGVRGADSLIIAQRGAHLSSETEMFKTRFNLHLGVSSILNEKMIFTVH